MSKRYQVTLKDDTAQKLEELAKELELSKSAVITLALQMYHEEKKA
ncbi:ribbon-helix-helix protein, CopG family [Salinicoccus sp. CNSTN-B1]